METKEREAVVNYLNTFTPMHGKFTISLGATHYERLPTRVVVEESMLERLFLLTTEWMDAMQNITLCRTALDENMAELNALVMQEALGNVQRGQKLDKSDT
jgi:hypothetical protein